MISLISFIAIGAFLLFMRKEYKRIKTELDIEVFGESPVISEPKARRENAKNNSLSDN